MKFNYKLIGCFFLLSSIYTFAQDLGPIERFNTDIEKAKSQNCVDWMNSLSPKNLDLKNIALFNTFMMSSLIERVDPAKFEQIMISEGDLEKMDQVIQSFVAVCKAFPTMHAWDAARKAYTYN